jgi:hypothetical protein
VNVPSIVSERPATQPRASASASITPESSISGSRMWMTSQGIFSPAHE